MISATLRPRPAKDPSAFYDELALTVAARRNALTEARSSLASGQPMTWEELIEWLRLQCWFEREEAAFVTSWLAETSTTSVFPDLCRKASAKARYHRLLLEHLRTLDVSMEDWTPEPEWSNWLSEFYANGVDALERVIAHNLTGEPAAMDSVKGLLAHVPDTTANVLAHLVPDRVEHRSLGQRAMAEYATTLERQASIHAWVMRSFELEQKARLAFDRRIRAIRKQAAANDAMMAAQSG